MSARRAGPIGFALLIVAFGQASAQLSLDADSLVHHVIVLLDRSGSMSRDPRHGAIGSILTQDLERMSFTDVHAEVGRPLLDASRGDYLSIVGFGLDSVAPDFDDFVLTGEYGVDFGFRYRQDPQTSAFDDLWSLIGGEFFHDVETHEAMFRKWYTALSFALPMSLHELGDPSPRVNRTFVFLVSDGEYNGLGDPVGEIALLGDNAGNVARARAQYEEILTTYYWKKLQPETAALGVSIQLFEIWPLARFFAIESLLEYDRVVPLRQAPGEYRADVRLVPKQNPIFSIEQLEVTLLQGATRISSQVLAPDTTETVVSFPVDRSLGRDDFTVSLRAWVHMGDSAYGVHVLHPEGDELQGTQGLARSMSVVYDPPPRLWGLIQVTDWMYDRLALRDSEVLVVTLGYLITGLMAAVALVLLLRWGLVMRDPGAVVVDQK